MSDRSKQNEVPEIDDLDLEADALIGSLEESEVEVGEEAPKKPTGPLFSDFNFATAVKKSIEQMGFEVPTEVQRQAIPKVLDGKDVLVTAQTGSGKTVAFLTPILTKMLEAVDEKPARFRRALIIAPTRELAEQIGQVARDLTFYSRRFRYAVVIGGSAYGRQLQQLRERPAFVIGTPGRLIDHIDRGTLKLDNFDFLVLDEADRMLDMGFEPQIEAIVKALPEKRQTMMFSATLPPEVKRLVSRYLKEPVRVSVGEENRAVATIKQEVVEVREADKEATLLREIDKIAGTMIVFTRTKMKADRVASILNEAGHQADALHGDLTQGARRRVTMNFREERIRILVATDIASRGLDIDHIQHVVNYDLPMVIEDYIHRIGRTGRAGREGHSIAFVTPSDFQKWARICKMQGLPSPRGAGGFSRDRGGRRNDGKFSRPRPEGRGFRDKKFGDRGERGEDSRPQRSFDRPQRSYDRPQPSRPYGGGDSRPPRKFEDRPASRPFEGDSRPQRRRFDAAGPQGRRDERPQRFRDDSHKQLPFKREGAPSRGEGPKTWNTDDTRPKREFKPRSQESFGDSQPRRPSAGQKRYVPKAARQRDENWGKPWNPKGPVKAAAQKASSGPRTQRY